MTRSSAAGAACVGAAHVLALVVLVASLLPVLVGPMVVRTAIAYSDTTVAIHVQTSCAADGWCRPEIYVERQDPAQAASVRVDYDPAWDPLRFNLTLRNVRYIMADAKLNYDTRGCGTFFADCPETEYLRWLMNRHELTAAVDTDVVLRFRVEHVPRPGSALLDGASYGSWSWDGSGATAYSIPTGVRTLRILFVDDAGPLGPMGDPVVPGALLAVLVFLTLLVLALRRR